MFRIQLSKKAEKGLKKLDKKHRKKVGKYIDLLSIYPFYGGRLEGDLKGYYRIKIPPLRIIYSVDVARHIVWIKAIGFRGGIYRS